MHATRMLLLSLLLAIGSPMLAGAQPGNGRGGGFGPGARSGRTYDPKTVETVTGVIASIERVDAGRGPFRGIHLVLQTDKGETLPAHLGPAWYLDKQAMKFSPGDKLAVPSSPLRSPRTAKPCACARPTAFPSGPAGAAVAGDPFA
jgi:hypothetical protein